MTTKNLLVLTGVVAILGAAAYLTTQSSASRAPALAGKKMVAPFQLADVATIQIGDALTLVAGENGWVIPSMQNYPADRARLTENLMRLSELKVGQIARGRALAEKTLVTVKDAAGQTLASVTLGDRHEKWGHGRYAEYRGTTVLVADTLDAFASDPMRWCDTKIVDTPYVNFKRLAAPTLTEDDFGFSTGVVAQVTIAGDTNRTVTVGNIVKDSTDRYLKIDQQDWVFVVPSYSVESLLPKPPAEEEKPAKEEKQETEK